MIKGSNDKPVVRKVDGVGRISIPPKLLEHLSIQEGSSVLLYMENEREIILTKDRGVCVFCGSEDVVIHSSEIEICTKCRQKPENISAIVDKRYEKQEIPNGRRLVIPFKIRHQLNINVADKIQIFQEQDYLRMKKIEE
jgi:bifunctional DNA-binding transcriptional regulator/antitoxin component of YhaV-PrlF toxin-antitoxin module